MTTQTEFFGPDLGRGPFAAHRIETAAVQIAAALAQLRAPLARSDDEIRGHANFIRELADALAPDFAAQVALSIQEENDVTIRTILRTTVGERSLLHIWLADEFTDQETGVAPDVVTWNSGTVLETISSRKRYWIVTGTTGVADVTVQHGSSHTWRWAAARSGRVYFSPRLFFDV